MLAFILLCFGFKLDYRMDLDSKVEEDFRTDLVTLQLLKVTVGLEVVVKQRYQFARGQVTEY